MLEDRITHHINTEENNTVIVTVNLFDCSALHYVLFPFPADVLSSGKELIVCLGPFRLDSVFFKKESVCSSDLKHSLFVPSLTIVGSFLSRVLPNRTELISVYTK